MCIGINIISACCCWHIYTASLIKVLTAHTPYSVGCILNRLVYSLAWKETRSSPHPVFLLRNYENGWKLCGSLQDEKVKITVELRWAERATGYSQVMSWHEFLLFFSLHFLSLPHFLPLESHQLKSCRFILLFSGNSLHHLPLRLLSKSYPTAARPHRGESIFHDENGLVRTAEETLRSCLLVYLSSKCALYEAEDSTQSERGVSLRGRTTQTPRPGVHTIVAAARLRVQPFGERTNVFPPSIRKKGGGEGSDREELHKSLPIVTV